MSPEQARGLPVDQRSDLWAFGCLLYEMLTGRRAFPGANASDVLAAVLRDEPDWSALPAGHAAGRAAAAPPLSAQGPARPPPGCGRRAHRADRGGHGRARSSAGGSSARLSFRSRRGGSSGGDVGPPVRGAESSRRRPGEGRGVTRLSLDLPAGLRLAEEFASPFAFAPDGAALALVARAGETAETLRTRAFRPGASAHRGHRGRLAAHVRTRREIARLLRRPQAEAGAACRRRRPRPGRDRGQPARGELGGGRHDSGRPPSDLRPVPCPARGRRAPALDPARRVRGRSSHRWPQVLPGGTHALFTVAVEDGTYDEARIEVVSLVTGERKRVLDGGAHARYLPSGHLVFVRGGRLFACPSTPPPGGEGQPQVVVEGVRYDPQNGGSHVAVSATGGLVYAPGPSTSSEHPLSLVDRTSRSPGSAKRRAPTASRSLQPGRPPGRGGHRRRDRVRPVGRGRGERDALSADLRAPAAAPDLDPGWKRDHGGRAPGRVGCAS